LVATRANFERAAHFKQYRLPGGEKAIEEPWRMAASVGMAEDVAALLRSAEAAAEETPGGSQSRRYTIEAQIKSGFNSPLTSSAGRLFDAVSAMLGLCDTITYEGQAAIRLEAAADANVTGHYPFELRDGVLDFGRAIRALVVDRQNVGLAAARFQNTVVAGIVRVCEQVRQERGLRRVALSGGVFQNEWVLTRTLAALREKGFEVFTNVAVPPNDGGLALGQAAVAAARMKQSCV
jgi:hydrogenase maturation protein HypF